MNRLERIYHIHKLLKSSRHPVPRQRLIEALEVSRATISRDLEYMRDFMDAPVDYDHQRNGYYYKPDAPEFELPGLWFNPSELYALLASEQLLEAVQPGLLSPYITPLKMRIRKLLEQSGGHAENVTGRILLRSIARRNTEPENFIAVANAVLAGHPLRITYHGRQRDDATTRTVHPQRLMHYRDNWFLVAWCEHAGEPRTFSLDRIRTTTPLDTPLKQLDDEALERHLGASYGIFTGEANEWAVLRFTPQAARWVEAETWHPDQIGQWQDGAYQLQIPYSDPTELIMEILKYGPEVEVVAPEGLRAEVAVRLRTAAGRYD